MARLFSPRPPPSEDLFYETYYSLSQQYPLLLLLLVIVLFGLLALLAVAWASGRVSGVGREWGSGAGCLLGDSGRVTASGAFSGLGLVGLLFFFFWPRLEACGILVPDQGSNPRSLHWKHGVLTTGHHQGSPTWIFFSMCFLGWDPGNKC